MKFRTEINVAPLARRFGHGERLFSIGSCFAGSIAARLARFKFRVESNPLGVLFNPFSIAEAIESLAAGKVYTEADLTFADGLWFSYAHHGSFSAPTPGEALARINASAAAGAEALRAAGTVIITFGTARVYEKDGRTVANCHKRPAVEFTRRMLSADGIAGRFAGLMEGALAGKQVILTVSPVRHLGDGFAENSLSKAILRVAVEELAGKYPSARYFPAFEIMNDDLRDYRFYAADMVHPSEEAVDYIWEKFSAAALTDETLALLPRIESLRRAAEHRPLHAQAEAREKFRAVSLRQALELQAALPDADFSEEMEFFAAK